MTSPTTWTPSSIPSAARFADGDLARAEEQRREPVDEDPVQLLGHRAVERAEPRLDVGDGRRRASPRRARPRASSSCRRRRAPSPASRRGRPARFRAASARSARRGCPSPPRGGRPAARGRARRRRSPRARGRSADPCGATTSSARPRRASESGPDLMNCGRLPTTESTRTP